MMAKESFFTAEEAKDKGLIDEIMFEESVQAVASASNDQMLPKEVIDSMRQFKSKDLPITNFVEPSTVVLNENETIIPLNQGDDEKLETIEELKAKHPDLYNQVFAAGEKSENERIKNIEELAVNGSEKLVIKAKFEERISAQDLAMQIIQNQKKLGADYLQNREKEAKELEGVGSSNAPEAPGNEAQEFENMQNVMKNAAQSVREVENNE